MSDAVDSKSFHENLVRNNSEIAQGAFQFFYIFILSCIFKHTQSSKYLYSLLAFDESQIPLIEYSKTTNSTAPLVAAISKK